jgi:hypothetical protein
MQYCHTGYYHLFNVHVILCNVLYMCAVLNCRLQIYAGAVMCRPSCWGLCPHPSTLLIDKHLGNLEYVLIQSILGQQSVHLTKIGKLTYHSLMLLTLF